MTTPTIITDSATAAINALASKLSIPASHLWDTLVAQAHVAMVMNIFVLAVIIVIILIWLTYCVASPVPLDIAVMGFILLLLVSYGFVYWIATEHYNAAYYALHKLTELMGR